jgi:hypothetical protein
MVFPDCRGSVWRIRHNVLANEKAAEAILIDEADGLHNLTLARQANVMKRRMTVHC